MTIPMVRRIAVLLAAASLAIACGSGSDAGTDGTPTAAPSAGADDPAKAAPPPPTVEQQLAERPWEIVSNKGETYLPNVFYADASQNEQIMPWAIDGHVMIDRLVYPTIGNPNLYTKSDPKEQLLVVLRIEDAAYDMLGAKSTPVAGSPLTKLEIGNDPATGFAFFLVPRSARQNNTEASGAISSGNGTGIYRIYPNAALVSPMPDDMPASLKARKTVRFVFEQNAMAKVPPGLYDLRFEVRRDNAIYKGVYEYEYNAVRVFDAEPDEYSVLNVTDTQVSVGSSYQSSTTQKLDELVQFVNTTNDANVRAASFITFNGDLHNGGSPASLRERTVATTYASEAKAVIDALKYLPVPIFLTTGNHDGYVATGHVPSAITAIDNTIGSSLHDVVDEQKDKPWPDFTWSAYQAYLDATSKADALGGWHKDIFVGSFMRAPKAKGFSDGWKEIPRAERNYILYDGFYQWQKSYGPLYYSHRFGKNFYVSLNSFELRQHRRAGWGMYTVNYGGSMSDVQMEWLDRELLRGKTDDLDVVLLAHHDPRGGHKSLDAGYYFDQLEYRSVYQSAINYLWQKIQGPTACKLPDWALPRSQEESCIHDGLQEWMRPDEELDCAWDERKDGVCDKALFDPKNPQAHDYFFSGPELMKRLTSNPNVRTVLLGHTHYNQLEVLETGDELLPGKLPVGGTSPAAMEFATIEVQNPMRAFSIQQSRDGLPVTRAFAGDYAPEAVPLAPILAKNERFAALYEHRMRGEQRFLDGPAGRRELVVMRLVSNADLANQTYNGKSAMGFAVLHLTKKADARAYDKAQMNRATFFVNTGSNVFTNVKTIDLDRTTHLGPRDATNPIEQLYQW